MAVLASYEGSNDDYENGGYNSGNDGRAQGFQLASAGTVTSVSLYGSKGNSVAGGTSTIEIRESTTTGTLLASKTFNATTLTAYGSPQWNEITLDSGVSLSSGTQYYLILRHASDCNASDEVRWSTDSTSPSYADGSSWAMSGGSWVQQSTRDKNFRINGTVTTSFDVSVFDAITTADVVGYYSELLVVSEHIQLEVTSAGELVDVNETVSISEALEFHIIYSVSVSESLSVSEGVTMEAGVTMSVVDLLSVAEEVTNTGELWLVAADTVEISEQIVVLADAYRHETNDSLDVTEDTVVTVDIAGVMSVDSLELAEATTLVVSVDINVLDSLSVVESLNALSGSGISIFDGLSLSEVITITGEIWGSTSDSVVLADVPVVQIVSDIIVTDSLSASESTSSSVVSFVSTSETVVVTETLQMSGELSVDLADDLSVTEDIESNVAFGVIFADILSLSEEIVLVVETFLSVEDTLTAGESIQTETFSNVSTDESISVSESVSLDSVRFSPQTPATRPYSGAPKSVVPRGVVGEIRPTGAGATTTPRGSGFIK